MTRDFKGIWIPKEVWLSKELTLQEKVFLVEIHSLDNENGCFANNEYFAKFFGLSKTRVSLVISSLIEKGYISSQIFEKLGNKRVLKVTTKFFNGYLTKVKEGHKQKLKRGLKQKLKYNNTNNNNTNNNTIKLHSPNPSGTERQILKRTKWKTSKTKETPKLSTTEKNKLRNKKFLPQVKQLKEILQEKKNIQINGQKLTAWTNSIRLLCDYDKVQIERIQNVLDWYAKHWMDDYVPVVESGSSFREKFTRLEAAIERSKTPKTKPKGITYGSRRFGKTINYDEPTKMTNEEFIKTRLAS